MTGDRGDESDCQDYEVGYGRPPKETRFKKGRSGNPEGRPKGSKSLKTLLMNALNDKVTVNENGYSKQISKREAAAKQIANRAAMGDLRTVKLIADLLSDVEEREDEKIDTQEKNSARQRISRKLDEMAARLDARFNLPPESE